MVMLTENAIGQVKKVIGEQSEPYVGIRVGVEGGGCSGFQYTLKLERTSREGDDVVQVDGFQLLIDPQSMVYLDGTEIDYVETLQAAGFRFNNPNVTGSCGCGESFQV
jgi:iron-sulfur cluster assembly protein